MNIAWAMTQARPQYSSNNQGGFDPFHVPVAQRRNTRTDQAAEDQQPRNAGINCSTGGTRLPRALTSELRGRGREHECRSQSERKTRFRLKRLGTKPLHANHADGLLGQNASDCGGGLEVFETGHVRFYFYCESIASVTMRFGNVAFNLGIPSSVIRKKL